MHKVGSCTFVNILSKPYSISMVNLGTDNARLASSSTLRLPKHVSVRGKRWAPKARTGCLDCRARRVKCDEIKPVCYNCQRRDRSCRYEGLVDINSKITERALRKGATTVSYAGRRGREPVLAVQPLTPLYGSSEETRYLDLYRSLSAPWFSRYFEPSLFGGVIPQSSWHHPALRHALVAVAMASEQRHFGTSSTRPYRRIWHYDQALKHLYSDRQVHGDIVLIACVLFWLHDNVMGDTRSAMLHLRGFLQIATEHKLKKMYEQLDYELELQVLRGFIYWGHSQDESFAEKADERVIAKIRERLSLTDVEYSQVFSHNDTDSVRKEIFHCVIAIAWATCEPPATTALNSITFREIRTFVKKWYRSVHLARPMLGHNDCIILECHHMLLLLVLRSQQTVHEGGPSDLLDDSEGLAKMDLILDKIESLKLESTSQSPHAKDLIMPVVPILAEVTRLAPTADRQARAFALLRNMNRVEAFWNSNIVAAFQEALVSTGHKKTISMTTEQVSHAMNVLEEEA